MDGYGFIASLVASLAWPTAAVVIASTQRKPVGRLIDRIKKAKLFGTEVEIGDELEKVRTALENEPDTPALPAPAEAPTSPSTLEPPVDQAQSQAPTSSAGDLPTISVSEFKDRLRAALARQNSIRNVVDELSTTSAQGTIVAAWLELEEGVRRILDINGIIPQNGRPSFIRSLYALRDHGFVSEATFEGVIALRKIRNEVVHSGTEVSLEEAAAFRATAEELLERIGRSGGLSRYIRSVSSEDE